MKKFINNINILLISLLAFACVGEFALCFIRGYSELWSTILVGSVLIMAVGAVAFTTKAKALYFVSTVLLGAGAMLLIAFPSYYLFLALAVTAITLIAEIIWLVTYLKNKP